MNVPVELQKADSLYTNFLPNYTPISLPFSIEKHLICPNWVLFAQNTPNFQIWAPLSLIKPSIAKPNFAKKEPKRQAHTRIPCQYKNPLPHVDQ